MSFFTEEESAYSRASSGSAPRTSRAHWHHPGRSRPGAPQPTLGAAKLFSRWFSDVKGGKHVVVVVVSSGEDGGHWIITAYITRKLAEGEVEWARS
jgi:hypothetical protein